MIVLLFRFGRVEGRQWDGSSESYEYDDNGLLSKVASRTQQVTKFTFGETKLDIAII